MRTMAITCTIVAAFLFLAGCQPSPEQPKSKTKQHQETKVASVLQLPGSDGVVYVIESPADDFGFEVNTCMLHVKGDASTMACSQPKMKYLESDPK